MQDMSLSLHDHIHKGERREELRKLFLPPGVFDGVVSVLVQQLTKNPIRPHICDAGARKALIEQLVTKIEQALPDREPRSLSDICEVLPCVGLDLPKANLSPAFVDLQERENIRYKLYLQRYQKFCYGHWRPDEVRKITNKGFKGAFSGALLWGEQGCGKSQILSYLTAWAHDSEWCSLAITDHERFVNATTDIFRFKNGLYLQHDLAQQLCKEFLTSNEQLLRDQDVDMSVYGGYDISGIRDDEPEPCPRVWDELRKTWSDAWKDQLFEHEVQHYEQRYEAMNYRLSDKLRDPKKLVEIAQAGVDDSEVAINAFAELLNQCYSTDKFQTMVCVDGINTWLQPSRYPSFRYANYRKLKQHIPPHDLALVRLLMKFDGHFLRNGFKAMATSHYRQFNHIATPDELGLCTQGYALEVDNLTLNDFRHAMRYYGYARLLPATYDTEW